MNDDVIMIPFIVHEAAQARYERLVRRLTIALVTTAALSVALNVAWIVTFLTR